MRKMFLSQLDLQKVNLQNEGINAVLFDESLGKVIKSDYAIVLGTSPEYARVRAEIAASFYEQGGTQKLIVSGAAVSSDVTESSFLREELIKRGVPEQAIIEEPHAYDTIQNMTCSLTEICKRTDIMAVESITVISEPFHMRRALSLANILLPKFIHIYGYTEGAARQREEWKTDERLFNCVKTELRILQEFIIKGRIKDIEI